MKKYQVLCKERDNKNITLFTNMTYKQAERKIKELKKDGASNIQLRVTTIGASSVLVG